MILSLDEIRDWRAYENLVADYFRQVKRDKEFNVENVEVLPTGVGADGGRDILVEMSFHDSIAEFRRKWVIQCKFHNENIRKSHLYDLNIPSLIHEYGANGYLLVCKNDVTAGLSSAFERLNKNCKFGYRYEIWTQQMLLNRVRFKRCLIDEYFPLYAEYLRREEVKLKGL